MTGPVRFGQALGSLWPPFCLSGCARDRFGRERVTALGALAQQHDFKAETGPNQALQKGVGGLGSASAAAR